MSLSSIQYLLLSLLGISVVLLVYNMFIVTTSVKRLTEKMVTSIFSWFIITIYLTFVWAVFQGIIIFFDFPFSEAFIPVVIITLALSLIYLVISRKLRRVALTFGLKHT